MSDQWAELAVEAMRSTLETNLAAELRTHETELGLSSGDLPDPVDYVGALTPFDNRSPLVAVWEDGFGPESEGGQRQGEYTVEVSVGYVYNGLANVEANDQLVRRSVTAIMRTVLGNLTLTGYPILGVEFVDASAYDAPGDESMTRRGYRIDFNVFIFSE